MKSSRSCHWLVPAAGTGSRMNSSLPKQFWEGGGLTVLEWTLNAIASTQPQSITVAVDFSYRDLWHARKPEISWVSGGSSRSESVRAAFHACPLNPDSVVLIHDAVRPFVQQALVDRLVDALEEFDVAIPALPITDTVKQTLDGRTVSQTIPRETLRLVQTPQAFRASCLYRIYEQASLGTQWTDEAMFAEAIGCTVGLVSGDENNRKLTHPSDWEWMLPLLGGTKMKDKS